MWSGCDWVDLLPGMTSQKQQPKLSCIEQKFSSNLLWLQVCGGRNITILSFPFHEKCEKLYTQQVVWRGMNYIGSAIHMVNMVDTHAV